MSHSCRGFIENRADPKLVAPAKQNQQPDPSIAPCTTVCEGKWFVRTASPRDVTRAQRKTATYRRGICSLAPAAFMSASVRPIKAIHFLANRIGEYQRPPSTKMTTPETRTGRSLTSGKCMVAPFSMVDE